MDSKEFTPDELTKREGIINDMKKNKVSLVNRYGKDAEKVMYGRATNIIKKMRNKEKIKEIIKSSLSKKINESDIEVEADKIEGTNNLKNASNTLDELERLLNKHDWYYMMSDSNQVYDKGIAERRHINSLISSLKNTEYEQDAKDLFNSKEPYTEQFGSDNKLKENNNNMSQTTIEDIIEDYGFSEETTDALIEYVKKGDFEEARELFIQYLPDDWKEFERNIKQCNNKLTNESLVNKIFNKLKENK